MEVVFPAIKALEFPQFLRNAVPEFEQKNCFQVEETHAQIKIFQSLQAHLRRSVVPESRDCS